MQDELESMVPSSSSTIKATITTTPSLQEQSEVVLVKNENVDEDKTNEKVLLEKESSTLEEKLETTPKEFNPKTLLKNLKESFCLISSSGGDFACSDRLSDTMALPGLELLTSFEDDSNKKYKAMPLPIVYKEQANEIIQIAKKSPYGKGEETIYDDNVRKSFELDTSQFRITNRMWQSELSTLLNTKIKSGLGIDKYKKVECKLYKLLLYEEGGHFQFHKDSEKECKQTCTLVIILPSIYEGGSFKIKHNDNLVEFDYASNSSTRAHFISFYSDCDHAVMPLTSGYRTCLVYNIIVTTDDNQELQIADRFKETASVREQLSQWLKSTFCNSPLIYLLEHEYTSDSLVFGCEILKGNDYQIYTCLKELKLPLLVFPAFFSKRVNVGFSDDDFFEEGEFLSISKFFFQNRAIFSNLPLKECQTFSSIQKELKCIRSQEHQTGNYGTQSSKWYQITCLVLFPDEIKLIPNLGFEFGLNYFKKMIEEDSEQVTTFFETFTDTWWQKPTGGFSKGTNHEKFLNVLVEGNQKELTERFLRFKCNPTLITPPEFRMVFKKFGFPDFRVTYFSYLQNLLERKYCPEYSIKDYLELFEPYFNLPDMKIIAKIFRKNTHNGYAPLRLFFSFCEKRDIQLSYSFEKDLFLPIFKSLLQNFPVTSCEISLCELFMGRDIVKDVICLFLEHKFPRALELIQEYGYNTFDPNLLYKKLDPTKYFENYKQDTDENQELKLFYSGFRKFIALNNLAKKYQDREKLFMHSYDAKENDIILYTLQRFEKKYQNDINIIIRLLDLCFVKSFKPIDDDNLLQQWINLTQKCLSYIETCVSKKTQITLTFKLPHIVIPCSCHLCTPIQQFIKSSNQDHFSTSTKYEQSDAYHLTTKLREFNDLAPSISSTSKNDTSPNTSTIKKRFNTKEAKVYQMKVMKYASENVKEVLEFMINYQADKYTFPSYSFKRILKSGITEEEREKREKEEEERIIQERLAQKEKEAKEKEAKKQKKEEEKLLKKKETQQKKERIEQDKKRRKLEKEAAVKHQSTFIEQPKMQTQTVSTNNNSKTSQSSSNQQTISSSVPKTIVPNNAQQTTNSQPVVLSFTYQLGNNCNTMTGTPLVPESCTASSLTPSMINFNTSLMQMNGTHQVLNQYVPTTAIVWTPNQTTQEFTNFFMTCMTQCYCIVVKCAPTQFFVLVPIQRFFPSNDFRLISVIVDINGINTLLAPSITPPPQTNNPQIKKEE